MPTQCSPDLFGFARVAGRSVVAGFDGGAITSDAGALLGQSDWWSASRCAFGTSAIPLGSSIR